VASEVIALELLSFMITVAFYGKTGGRRHQQLAIEVRLQRLTFVDHVDKACMIHVGARRRASGAIRDLRHQWLANRILSLRKEAAHAVAGVQAAGR
jgi:aspartyl/asparaginyl-tRNA synthetase